MEDELRFDVYGQLTIMMRRSPDGWWVADEIGTDGKRRVRSEVVIPPEAGVAEIAQHLETIFHEWGRPGAEIMLLSPDTILPD